MSKIIPALLFSALWFALPTGAQTSSSSQQQPGKTRAPANQFVREVIQNELNAETNDHSHWMLRLEQEKSGKMEFSEVVETKDGDLERLLSVNGQPLTAQQQHQQEQRIQQFVQDPQKLRKSQQDKNQDEARSQRMLKMLPDAFLFEYAERRGDLVELKFKPNPRFHPSSHESAVFHAMEGVLWLNAKDKRLAEISGHLVRPVKFAGGLLGHLDAGGEFHVKQDEVEPGYWELALLNVNMKGKALFFKTISVQQKMNRSDFRRIPDSTTVAQGANLLQQQVRTANTRAANRKNEAAGSSRR